MTDGTHNVRNPRAEAIARAGSPARVLEPSPPAVTSDTFADDPVELEDGAVMPDGLSSNDWSTWSAVNPGHETWVADNWLGGQRTLPAVPGDLSATRVALHRLAAYVIAPVRHQANGKFGLRWVRGGFGTPFFGNDRQIRVVDTELVDQVGDTLRSTPITTLRAAAEFLGTEIDTATAAEHDSPPLGDADEPLAVDPVAAAFLGNWFGMAFAALETVRADPASVDPSRPQLWPGHFDPAIEIGDEDHRGSYGASPGDPSIDEPYLYVSIWWPDRIGIDASDPRWNAPSFTGAVLRLSDFRPGDPVVVAANFFAQNRDALES